AQGSVGHVRRQKSPRSGCSSDLLPEFECFLGADQLGVDSVDAWDHLGQILFDSFLDWCAPFSELIKHTCQITSIARQKITGIGRLQVTNANRVQVVESHARKGFVDRPKFWQARCVDKIKPVNRGGGRDLHAVVYDSALLHSKLTPIQPSRARQTAFLSLDFESAAT